MKYLINTVSFIAVMSVIPGALAATSRASVIGQTASRLPSIAGYVNPVSIVTGTATGTSTASSLLSNADCIDAYKSCVSGSDACGADFEECTTNVLFHAQMPKCLSVLAQCSASGINDLFGTSSVAALSTVAEKNTYGEVTRYTYPTDGSVLGQMITGAAIANKYDTQQCVKRYTSCLKKENVCGNDFELCTTGTEFKKQSIYCASTLARCQSEGIIELFGQTNTSIPPKADSRLGMMINDGAELAAANAVSTCYKVADQCILNACGANPAKCMVDSSVALANMTEAINNGATVSSEQLANWAGNITSGDVNKYLRNMCQETIGGNKYCYMTSNEGKMPKASDLTDEDNREMVFEDIYASRMNSAMKQRLQTLLDKFDEKTKGKCVETIKSCAMRTCGGGVGSVCYAEVFKNGKGSINGANTYDEIRLGCEAIVNTDPSCQYAVAATNNSAYMYTFTDNSTFTTLFPAEETGSDPVGVVAALNASLATSYNEAAIANMKKQCANTAISCVKSMCGKDYANCYRNRTDIMSNTYNTDSEAFNKSMNKVGGVLDYTIVTGLCVNQVKNAKVCEEHLKIESVKLKKNKSSIINNSQSSWGGDVRSDWLGAAGSVNVKESKSDITVGCRTKTDNCDTNSIEACGYIDEEGCLYDEEVTQAWTDYVIDQSATNLFQQVLMDIEKEAQAKYNAKLTKEQNICLAQNGGGIMGATDMGSSYRWVKLKSGKIPKTYNMQGLKTSQFVQSNDLYGSFCLAKITVKSDDKFINEVLKDTSKGDKSTVYFAMGDTFQCGSWIDEDTLDKITEKVKKDAGKNEGVSSWKGKTTMLWTALGGAAAGGVAGGLVGNYLANGKVGGGLLNSDAKKKANTKTNAGSCVNNLSKCLDYNDVNSCRAGLRDARAAGISADMDWASDATNSTVVCQLSGTDYTWCPMSAPTGEGEPKKWCESNPVCCKGESPDRDRLGKCEKSGTWVYPNTVMYTRTAVANANSIDKNNIQRVLDDCQNAEKENKSSSIATGVGATIGALAVGGLGAGIAATALEAKKRSVQDKAVKEWLETFSDKIQCYLGATELGSYGDVVALTFDE